MAELYGAGIILLFFCLAGAVMFRENRKRKRWFLERIKGMWGQISKREYTYDELEHISQYFYQNQGKGFFIDDITWNDLDMDQVYALLNQSVSPVGDEYLYRLLRTPVFEEKELEKRQKTIAFFKDNPKEREKVQEILSHIRKPGNVGFFEAVRAAKDAPEINGRKHLAFFILLLLSLAVFIIRPGVGVFFFMIVCVVNISSYYGSKRETDLYLTSLRCVQQLLKSQREMEKLSCPGLEELMERGKTYKKELSGFQRGSFVVLNRTSVAGGGMEDIFWDYIRILTHVDLIKFSSMMKHIQKHMGAVLGLLELFGYLDSMISIGSYRESLPYFTLPSLGEQDKVEMEVRNLYHPLLDNPVANSIWAKGGILVTGSNASGKSTFLKNVALNAILAQTIYTCTAHSYRAPYCRVMTSMALRDNISGGESYYIVEIRSLKRILEAGEEESPLLCIIDEVLRGTNTIERIGASSRILAKLRRPDILSFAATHDIELTYILEDLYENFHFEEEFSETDILFNYILKEGRVTTRNAIRLLEHVGYDRALVEEAKKAVQDFEKTGIWKNILEEPEKVSIK